MPPNQITSQDLTLPDIASILGINPDTALRWAIGGRLQVDQKGFRTIIRVAAPRNFTNPQPERVLIVTHASHWPPDKTASPDSSRFPLQ